MNFQDFYWADSDIENINVEYNHATLIIWNAALKKRLSVECSGFVGITNLCIWDDMTIMNTSISLVNDVNNDFVRQLYTAYDKDFDYGGRKLANGLLELKIELANYISFSLYCQKINVQDRGQGGGSASSAND